MNAAADITSLKENLGDFRKVLVTMFERLKSSAALFDEIRLLVSFISPTTALPMYFLQLTLVCKRRAQSSCGQD